MAINLVHRREWELTITVGQKYFVRSYQLLYIRYHRNSIKSMNAILLCTPVKPPPWPCGQWSNTFLVPCDQKGRILTLARKTGKMQQNCKLGRFLQKHRWFYKWHSRILEFDGTGFLDLLVTPLEHQCVQFIFTLNII